MRERPLKISSQNIIKTITRARSALGVISIRKLFLATEPTGTVEKGGIREFELLSISHERTQSRDSHLSLLPLYNVWSYRRLFETSYLLGHDSSRIARGIIWRGV